MDRKKNIFHPLEHGGNSSKLNIFSGLRNEEASVFSNASSNNISIAITNSANHKEKDIYQQLLEKGYSKRDIHAALHKLMLWKIQEHKQNAGNKIKKSKHQYSSFLHRLISGTFSAFKRLFAVKPKNPV